MDTAVLVFAGVTLWFALRGFWLGLPIVFVRLLALAAGYATALWGAPHWVTWVDAHTPLDGLSPYPATLVAAFLGGAFLTQLAGHILILTLLPEERRHCGRLPAVGLNGAFGAGVGLVAVWCVSLLQAAVHPERAAQASALQAVANQAMATAITGFIRIKNPERAAERAPAVAGLLAQPAQTVSDLHYLANDAALQSVLRDPDAQRLMRDGDITGLQQQRTFQALANDPRIQDILLRQGWLAGDDTHAPYTDTLAHRLSDTFRKVDAVRDDPGFQAILNDPEYRKQLQQGNLLALLNDDRTGKIAAIVMAAQPSSTGRVTSPPNPASPTTGPAPSPAAPETIHRWQDANGHWHFSDQVPR